MSYTEESPKASAFERIIAFALALVLGEAKSMSINDVGKSELPVIHIRRWIVGVVVAVAVIVAYFLH